MVPVPPQSVQREGDVVDVGAVQVELGEVAAGELGQLGDRADAVLVAGIVAAPDRQRRAPVAVAGQRPVDVALEPLAEAAVLDVLGVPADALVLAQQDVARARRCARTTRSWPSR